jgi:hypothetical protein
MDAATSHDRPQARRPSISAALCCRCCRPNAQELEAHADVLRQLDKASGGKTVWQAVGA